MLHCILPDNYVFFISCYIVYLSDMCFSYANISHQLIQKISITFSDSDDSVCGCCMHTDLNGGKGTLNPWWAVDLIGTFRVKTVILFNTDDDDSKLALKQCMHACLIDFVFILLCVCVYQWEILYCIQASVFYSPTLLCQSTEIRCIFVVVRIVLSSWYSNNKSCLTLSNI